MSLGKPAEGKITTSIERNAAGELSILFKDDGAGISLDNIRHAAVSKGLLSADKAEQLSNQECLKLMFKPGFSTASAVDKVSGRGVGMDIIGATLNELNGRIGIGFTKGSHSEFRITIPLNDGSMTTSGEEHAFVNS